VLICNRGKQNGNTANIQLQTAKALKMKLQMNWRKAHRQRAQNKPEEPQVQTTLCCLQQGSRSGQWPHAADSNTHTHTHNTHTVHVPVNP